MTVFFTVSGVGQALAGFVVDRVGALRVLFENRLPSSLEARKAPHSDAAAPGGANGALPI